MTNTPDWTSSPLEESSTALCERCGQRRALQIFADFEAENPPHELALCDECLALEAGRRMARDLREEFPDFPEHPTDDDYRRLFRMQYEWLQELGEESRRKRHGTPDPPSA